MIEQADFLKYAFAEKGDRIPFPLDRDAKNMSLEEGFNGLFSQNPESGGIYLNREQFNQLMYLISSGTRDLQLNGGRLFDMGISGTIGYPAGARVIVYYNVLTRQIEQQPTMFNDISLSQTISLVSMKENNQVSPFEAGALFSAWWIDDGLNIGDLKICSADITNTNFKIPSGYVDIGNSNPDFLYSYADYPRINYLKTQNALPALIIDNNDNTTFKILDCRAYTMQVFNNGGEIDPNREFNTLQGDAIRNIKGTSPQISCAWNSSKNCTEKDSPYYDPVFYNGLKHIVTNADLNLRNIQKRTFDASRCVPTANRNRVHNMNIKAYIKL